MPATMAVFAKVAGKRSYAFVEKGARMSPL
jgi:hypothetical protein